MGFHNDYSEGGRLGFSPSGSVGSQTYQPDGKAEARHSDNGYRGLGFDPGEGALETAPTSKEGSRRATFPMGFIPEDVTGHSNTGPLRFGN